MLERIPVDLTVPSPRALAYVLRHREHWPKGFKFNFNSCCAMDLACELWQVNPWVQTIATALGMPVETAHHIFICGHTWSGRLHVAITPEMVADQIDIYLEQAAE